MIFCRVKKNYTFAQILSHEWNFFVSKIRSNNLLYIIFFSFNPDIDAGIKCSHIN